MINDAFSEIRRSKEYNGAHDNHLGPPKHLPSPIQNPCDAPLNQLIFEKTINFALLETLESGGFNNTHK